MSLTVSVCVTVRADQPPVLRAAGGDGALPVDFPRGGGPDQAAADRRGARARAGQAGGARLRPQPAAVRHHGGGLAAGQGKCCWSLGQSG